MKRLFGMLFVVLVSLVMFSCKTKTEDENVLSKVDKYVKTEFVKNLKDPGSFEKVSCVITRKSVTKEFDTKNLDYYKKENDQVKVDSIQSKINSTPDNFVGAYWITYTYRAKNGFGGLDVFTQEFRFDPYLNGVDVMKEEHKNALKYNSVLDIEGGTLWIF
jgi:hypothetical protein